MTAQLELGCSDTWAPAGHGRVGHVDTVCVGCVWGVCGCACVCILTFGAADALLGLGDVAAASAAVQEAVQAPREPREYIFGGGNGLPAVSSEAISAQEGHSVLLIDSFTFNGEIAAEVRLNATAHLFDVVIVVEAWEPHSVSRPRKTRLFAHTRYWREVFGRFGNKVKVVEVSGEV